MSTSSTSVAVQRGRPLWVDRILRVSSVGLPGGVRVVRHRPYRDDQSDTTARWCCGTVGCRPDSSRWQGVVDHSVAVQQVRPSGQARDPSGSPLAPNTKYRAVRRRVSVTCVRFSRKAALGASSGSGLVWRQREVDRKPSAFLWGLARGTRGIASGTRAG